MFKPLTPNEPYSGRTAPLTSKRCILYIYSTNIGTEYFKQGIYSPFFPLQNAVCFISLTYLVPVLFTFHIQDVLKLKKNNSCAKRFIQEVQFFCRSQMTFRSTKYSFIGNTKGHYNVGLQCTDMLHRIYWYVVTDGLADLNATFGVNIPKRVKLVPLFTMNLKLMNLFETYVNIYHYTDLYVPKHDV